MFDPAPIEILFAEVAVMPELSVSVPGIDMAEPMVSVPETPTVTLLRDPCPSTPDV
jgi:hypothetical protein